MGGVRKEGSEGLEYHQRTSHGQGCVEACYSCARTMSWLRDLMGFTSSLPQLVWDKRLCCCCCANNQYVFGWNLGLGLWTSSCSQQCCWVNM
uniref:Uncharacterized protein n=1 Tax=Aegilops tauschii subsp. strangulata TaxID=200361 RepID=A0A452XWY3_AEGTS